MAEAQDERIANPRNLPYLIWRPFDKLRANDLLVYIPFIARQGRGDSADRTEGLVLEAGEAAEVYAEDAASEG